MSNRTPARRGRTSRALQIGPYRWLNLGRIDSWHLARDYTVSDYALFLEFRRGDATVARCRHGMDGVDVFELMEQAAAIA